MRGDSGAGHRRPLRKRVRTARAIESERQKHGMNWEDDDSEEIPSINEGTIRAIAADKASNTTKATRGPG